MDGTSAVLHEGDSFLLTLSYTFEVPENPSVVRFSYDATFDTTGSDSINDAFEVALLGPNGNTLVLPYAANRDSYFNSTAEESAAWGTDVTVDENMVTLDVSGLFSGTEATLVFRLVNNDQDVDTTVRINSLELPGEEPDQEPTLQFGLVNDTAPTLAPVDSSLRTDLLTNDSRIAGTVSDDGTIQLLEVQVDSGSFQDITSSLIDDHFAFAPASLTPGSHLVTVRAIDDSGQIDQQSLSFVVNAPPALVTDSNLTSTEGAVVAFDGSLSSDADGNLYSFAWAFDDGTSVSNPVASKSYPDDGLFAVTLTITDTAGSVVSETVALTVENAPAELAAIDRLTGQEGSPVTLALDFVDPGVLDTHTVTVDWGDELPPVPVEVTESGGAGQISGSHSYRNEGIYPVTVTVRDDSGAESQLLLEAHVSNQSPTILTAIDVAGTEGASVDVVATFRDPGLLDTHTATITWSDGTQSAGIVTEANGLGTVTASHIFGDNDVFSVLIQVEDDFGDFATSEVAATIQNIAPAVMPTAVQHVTPGVTVDLVVATFLDPGFGLPDLGVVETHTALIHWGDGTPVAPGSVVSVAGSTGMPTRGTVRGTHVYKAAGLYSVSVTVADDDGGSSSATFQILVTAAVGTKFFVVDRHSDENFRYGPLGQSLGSTDLAKLNNNPTGAASTAAGDTLWVVDISKRVFVYSADGNELGQWRIQNQGGNPQDITTNGQDIWIVDAAHDSIQFFDDAAGIRTGDFKSTASYPLHRDNTSPTGIVTDGQTLWVSDDRNDAVFVYTLTGNYLGHWKMDSRNADVSGITLDPSGATNDLWMVDRIDRRVYRYANARNYLTGNRIAADSFVLAIGNSSPEGIADPPVLNVDEPGSGATLPVGQTVVLSGQTSDGAGPAYPVRVNGQPVDSFDAAGNFFHQVEIASGTNVFVVESSDIAGATTTKTVVIDGDSSPVGIDFGQLTVVSGSSLGLYGRTSWQDTSSVLHADFGVTNIGQYTIDGPVLVGVANISDPTVRLLGAVGTTPDGTPYFDISPLVEGGSLKQGESSGLQAISFFAPSRQPFTYDLVFFAGTNQSPQFTTVPDVEAIHGRSYWYDVNAKDPEDDALSLSLVEAPADMTIVSDSGQITWNPTSTDVGTHAVVVRAEDGRGGRSQQRYVLSVIELPPNRPPLFTSVPQVAANVSAPYIYQAAATDADGDTLSFAFPEVVTNPVAVVNPSFEAQVLSDGASVNNGLTGWTIESGAAAGPYNPPANQYTGTVPHGQNVAFSNGATISQILAEPLTAGTRYTLAVDVGDRLNATLPDFSVELWAGGIFLAGASAPRPDNATFATVSVMYDATLSSPPLGQPLQIRLRSDGAQTNFDNVRMSASASVIPPAGMTINPATGEIAWTPTAAQVGPHNVRVLVTDGRGGTAAQDYTVVAMLALDNHAPVIVSNPLTQFNVGPPTAPAVPINLSAWSVVQYEFNAQPNANWQLSANNTVATQVVNADASILVSDFSSSSDRIEGTWRVTNLDNDDDFVGFVFGYQDPQHYYLFDWKGATQDDALVGMTVKVVNTATPVTSELWNTFGDGQRVRTMFHNSIPWQYDTDYGFELDYQPGAFTITVRQGNTVLASVALSDDTYTSGRFGFYNYSQGIVRYSGFSRQDLASRTYVYPVQAMDPDGDALSYSLPTQPAGMNIDPKSGLITWQVTAQQQPGRQRHNPKSTYLHTNGDPNSIPTAAIELASLGIKGGDQVHLETLGDVALTSTSAEVSRNLVGVFSSSSTLLGAALLNRVAGAIDAGTDVVTGNTFIGTQPTDIPQDFAISLETNGGTFIQVPLLATHLFISLADSFYGDDSDPDNDLALRVTRLPLHPVTVQVDDGRGGSDAQSFVVELTQIPPGEIRGIAFHDLNRDGSRDLVEPGLPAWHVYLDQNSNGLLDSTELSTTTDASGAYAFRDLAPGTYTVALKGQPGSEQTAPGGLTHADSLAAGQVVSERHFGVVPVADPSNRLPAITSDANLLATSGIIYQYQPVAVDPDGDSLRFDLPVKPSGMAIDPLTGRIDWAPGRAEGGVHDVILRVQDGRGGLDLQYYSMTVAPPNTAPTITSTPPGPASVANVYEYPVRAQDADGDSLTFHLVNGPVGMSISQTSGRLTWTPTASQVGAHTVAMVVRDGRDGEAAHNLTLLAVSSADNRPPTISSHPRLGTRLGNRYLYLVEAADLDGDPLTYHLDSVPAGMTIADRLITWEPSSLQLGDHAVELRVDDGRGGEATQSFTLSVATEFENSSPVITSNPRRTVTLGQEYRYGAVGTDLDGDPLVWSLDQSPAGLSLDPRRGALRWHPTFDQLGSHEVTLRLTDSGGGTATQSFTIDVQVTNRPPLFTTSPPTAATTGYPYLYAVGATDPDGDQLTFGLTTAPAGMTIDAVSGLVRWTPPGLPSDELIVIRLFEWVDASQVAGIEPVTIRIQDGRGGSNTQSYAILVANSKRNLPPVITSRPLSVAAPDEIYQYSVTASDPDGDTLTFSLSQAPAGMTINAASGVIGWTPAAGQTGLHSVTVLASDQNSAALQRFFIQVAANAAPVIIVPPNPPTSITQGARYNYDVRAMDAEGQPLTYALTQAPAGMLIDNVGRITWDQAAAPLGSHQVAVQVTDPLGLTDTLLFQLAVQADTRAPMVSLQLSNNPADINSEVSILVTATDDVGVVAHELTVDGVTLPLDPNGWARLKTTAIGTFAVVATARDAAGNTRTAQELLVVIDSSDVNAPFVDLSSPEEGAVVTAPTEVRGTVADDNLLFYTLSVAPLGRSNFIEFARGTTNVTGSALGVFDPTLLANDVYTLRLKATDAGGNFSIDDQEIHVGGNLKLGNFALSFTDLTVPVLGVPITVARTYDTLDSHISGDFGFGWRLEFRDASLRTSVMPTDYEGYGIFNPFKVGSRVYLTLPGGTRQGFTFEPTRAKGLRGDFLGIFEPSFKPDPGVKSSLTVTPSDLRITAEGEVFDYATGIAYNPASGLFGGSYLLTTQDGIAYNINAETGLISTIGDTHHNVLTLSDSGITGPNGISVGFERDPQRRIKAVIDPAGERIRYGYNMKGDLVSVTDRTNNTTQLVYRDSPAHYLEQVIDPLGRTGVRTEYDDQGRLISIIDAAGNPVEFAYDPANLTATITDQFGNPLTQEYDVRGNIVTEIDALGGITRRTFDANNNMLTETDELNRTTDFTYNERGDVLSRTDPLGNTTRSTFQAFTFGTEFFWVTRGRAAAPFTRVRTITDPLGNTVTASYDTFGSVLADTDALGNTTAIGNNKAGNPTMLTDPNGATFQVEYDGSGNVIRQVDGLGNATSFSVDVNGNLLTSTSLLNTASGVRTLVTRTEYDAEGRMIAVIDAEGGVTRTQYDAAGNRTATIDGLGHRTEYRYDERGKLTETIFPDATPADLSDNPRTKIEYDAGGQVAARIDELGRRTEYQYDALGHLMKSIHPDNTPADPLDNPFTQTEYDAAGQVTAQVDENGNRTEFRYDLAGNQIVVRDKLENETSRTYDAAGRLITETDALGHTTRYAYNATGRVTNVTDAGGHVTHTEYDAAGRKTATVDPLGRRTEYRYDDRNMPTEIIYPDATPADLTDNPRSRVQYDEVGRASARIDELGRRTEFEYDGLGRMVKTIYPDDTSADVLDNPATRMEYDAAGQAIRRIDQDGNRTEFRYDARGRAIVVRDVLGNETTRSFDAAGQLIAETDALGFVTRTEYDAEGRMIAVIDAEGGVTRTQYDAAGNRTATIDGLGHRTEYRYDERGKLIETILPDATLADLSDNPRTKSEYDAAGKVAARINELGRRTEYQYDALGRLVKSIYADNTPTHPLDNPFTKTEYDAAGQVTAQVDENGNRTEFRYDAQGRLVVARNALGHDTTRAYDAAGQLISVTDAMGHETQYSHSPVGRLLETQYADSTTTISTFDDRGLELSRTDQAGRMTRYEYDLLGRLTVVVDALGQRTTYGYNAVGGLISYTDANGHVTSYEVDGLRRRSATILPVLPGQQPLRSTTDYDAVGNVVSTTDYNGDTITYTYDERNRQTAKRYPDATSVTFGYTVTGQRASVTDGRGTTSYAYDSRDRLIARIDPDQTAISYRYDAAGNRTAVTTPAGTTTYAFDVLNRQKRVNDPDGGITHYTYDTVGNLTSTELPNGIVENRTYDRLNRVTFLENVGPSGLISSFTYTLGANGRRDAVVENTGRRVDYSYDSLDRLTRERIIDALLGDRTVDNTYDAVGNRLTRADSVEGLISFDYDVMDRLLTENLAGQVTNYTYDNNGNTLSREGATDAVFYNWDFDNRLIAADTNGDGTIDVLNAYDADGIRVSQTIDGQETRFLIDSQQANAEVLLEYLPSGLIVASYVFGNDLISRRTDGQQVIYLKDALGSVRALTNADGQVVARYGYDAFGRALTPLAGPHGNYLFRGEQFDPVLGQYYLRARYYDPSLGRFTATDPLRDAASDASYFPVYAYAQNDPVNRIDPSGMMGLSELAAALKITAILGAGTGALLGGIAHGWKGALYGGVAGLFFTPLIAGSAISAGVGIALAAEISVGTGIFITGSATSLIFAAAGVQEVANAKTSRERAAATIGLIFLAAGWGLGVKPYYQGRSGKGTFSGEGALDPVLGKWAAESLGAEIIQSGTNVRMRAGGREAEIVDLRGLSTEEIITKVNNAEGELVFGVITRSQQGVPKNAPGSESTGYFGNQFSAVSKETIIFVDNGNGFYIGPSLRHFPQYGPYPQQPLPPLQNPPAAGDSFVAPSLVSGPTAPQPPPQRPGGPDPLGDTVPPGGQTRPGY